MIDAIVNIIVVIDAVIVVLIVYWVLRNWPR